MTGIPIVLTIAGSDSGGCAGIQADIKSFSANRVYGASVITALTAQNTLGVTAIHDVPAAFVAGQIDAVFSDLDIKAVKIGMLSRVAIIESVAEGLKKHAAKSIVLDPVMVATSGDLLLEEQAVSAIRSALMPLASLVTPNLHEAAKLVEGTVAETESAMVEQARELLALGAKAVLIKGGHSGAAEAADLLVTHWGETWYRAKRIETLNTHGTGCSLSSTIAANLAHGQTLPKAVENAKLWLTGAIRNSGQLDVGAGSGPVHHFYNLWGN